MDIYFRFKCDERRKRAAPARKGVIPTNRYAMLAELDEEATMVFDPPVLLKKDDSFRHQRRRRTIKKQVHIVMDHSAPQALEFDFETLQSRATSSISFNLMDKFKSGPILQLSLYLC